MVPQDLELLNYLKVLLDLELQLDLGHHHRRWVKRLLDLEDLVNLVHLDHLGHRQVQQDQLLPEMLHFQEDLPVLERPLELQEYHPKVRLDPAHLEGLHHQVHLLVHYHL